MHYREKELVHYRDLQLQLLPYRKTSFRRYQLKDSRVQNCHMCSHMQLLDPGERTSSLVPGAQRSRLVRSREQRARVRVLCRVVRASLICDRVIKFGAHTVERNTNGEKPESHRCSSHRTHRAYLHGFYRSVLFCAGEVVPQLQHCIKTRNRKLGRKAKGKHTTLNGNL